MRLKREESLQIDNRTDLERQGTRKFPVPADLSSVVGSVGPGLFLVCLNES